MEKRNLLSEKKTVKWLALFIFTLTMAFLFTTQNAKAAGTTFKVQVTSGYLALRSEKAFDRNNEIGQLNTGDLVEVMDKKDSTYWYAYSPKLNKSGYVDKNYLQVVENTTATNDSWTVKVKSGYLALRNTAAYNDSNEIGRLNTGDTVLVKDSSDSTYWYVYAPKLDKSGYVDNRYIYNSGLWTVKVEKGYLALRNQAAYNDSNEIGRLNTGDMVQVKDTSDSNYWYVYVPQLDKTGYVDKDYLTGGSEVTYPTMTVQVEKGFLALSSAKAYDKNNEIAQLNTGDTVEIIEKEDSTYWYVYVPKLGKEGYVDKNYLKNVLHQADQKCPPDIKYREVIQTDDSGTAQIYHSNCKSRIYERGSQKPLYFSAKSFHGDPGTGGGDRG